VVRAPHLLRTPATDAFRQRANRVIGGTTTYISAPLASAPTWISPSRESILTAAHGPTDWRYYLEPGVPVPSGAYSYESAYASGTNYTGAISSITPSPNLQRNDNEYKALPSSFDNNADSIQSHLSQIKADASALVHVCDKRDTSVRSSDPVTNVADGELWRKYLN